MQKCLGFDKKNTLLANEWSAAKCAAWKIAVMSLVDGSNSQVYKQKLGMRSRLPSRRRSWRKTVREHADV